MSNLYSTPKGVVVFIFFIVFSSITAQTKKVSRNWTSFTQSIEVAAREKTKFKLEGSIKVDSKDTTGYAGLWARVDTVSYTHLTLPTKA